MSTKTKAVLDLKLPHPPNIALWPRLHEASDLAHVAFEALWIKPPRYVRSIFGSPWSWWPPHGRFSEFNIIDPWRLLTTIRYLMDVTIPAAAVTAPAWAQTLLPPIVNRRFWRPTSYYRQPDPNGSYSTYPNEHWFFINGVGTNEDVARINSSYLARLFYRPISVIQNATDSLFLDLYECAIGKGFKTDPDDKDRKTMTEPAWRATKEILEAVNTKRTHRVVIIAHSQGTIIAANVLRAVNKALERAERRGPDCKWHKFTENMMGSVQAEAAPSLHREVAQALSKLTADGVHYALEKMAKIEVYTFANCADIMCYVDGQRTVPYLEHFANENDLVARLGVLSPLHCGSDALIEIDGNVFKRDAAWGHLLNEHHLNAIDDYLDPRVGRTGREENPYRCEQASCEPRLYEYFHGKCPDQASPDTTRSVRPS